MVQRATNHRRPNAKYHVGRGITLCGGLRTFAGFFATLGENPPNKVLDRWPDNDGNYSCGKCAECLQKSWPLNVRWATYSESAINRRSTHAFEVQGVKGCLRELAEHFHISYRRVLKRLKAGWTVEETFTKPVRQVIQRRG